MRRDETYKRKTLEYIDQVVSGERNPGELEKLAVQRYLDDVDHAAERGFYFDEKAAKRAFTFCGLIRHYKGEWAGKEFIPEGWECFILWNIFGWMKKGGVRRFRYAVVEVPRKNGKTMLAAVIALIGLIADNEAGAEVYSAAVSKEQAAICWDAAKNMVLQSPILQKNLQVWRSSITYEGKAGFYKPLSKETKNKDGLNPHFAICDEMHAWPTDDIYNLIKSGMGARRQPLIFSITTAGFDMSSPYYSMRRVYIDVLKGIKQDDSTFVLIFCPDEGDDWKDPKTWHKASPNLGVSVSEEYMMQEFNDAMNKGGTTEVNFKTKNLNMWVDAPDVWIRDEKVAACDFGTKDEDLLGQRCFAGLDLAAQVDLNAFALYFPDNQPKPAWKFFFWIPEGKVKEKEDRVDYRTWVQEGWIRITPGDVIDLEIMEADLTAIIKDYDIVSIAFDPFKAYHGLIQALQRDGFDDILDEFNQGIRNMSEPTKRIEADICSGSVDLMKNPVIRWMFRNVVIYHDANDNIKMDKGRSIEKIDGCVAMADAYGTYMSQDISDIADVGVAFVNI